MCLGKAFCNSFRVSEDISKAPDFTQRFAWFVLQFAIILANVWFYTVFGTAFAYVPPNYQWLLGLITPIPRILSTKLLLFACYKSAGKEKEGKYSIRYTCLHYIETKHVVFCSIIIGGIATRSTMYCILGMRCILSIYKCWKVIKSRSDEGTCPELESKIILC